MGQRVVWVEGNATALPYEDETLDRVLSALMFHHLSEAQRPEMLAEVIRVLKPGGRLHLLDMAGPGVMHRNEHVRSVAGDVIPNLLRAAGFSDVQETGSGRLGTRFFAATSEG